nr:DUF2252 domain-containing protein [Granulicella arctica]
MQGRVRSLISLKYQRMSASPFGFFRGAAPVMAYDLSLSAHTGIVNQLCGDAHVQNLGAYCGIDGRLIFDINDFDETIRGPFEWDVKRMATSILLAGEQAKVKGSDCRGAAQAFLDSYCRLMKRLSLLPILDVARFQVHRLEAMTPILKILLQAERATPLHSRDQLTEITRAGRIFRSNPPVLWRVRGDERRAALASLDRYRKTLLPERQHFLAQFRPIDVAFKVVGTGSVGLRDYCVYLEGNGPDDPLFLQIKEETASAYAPYLQKSASPEMHNGQRVADGQRALQLQSDPFLGWTSFGRRDYLVRQLNDHKASLDVTTLNTTGLIEYAQVCGEMLARGHARSGDAREVVGYLGGGKRFKAAILEFASAYADQTTEDWKALLAHQHKKKR